MSLSQDCQVLQVPQGRYVCHLGAAEVEVRIPIAYGPYSARANSMSNFIIMDNEGNLIQFFGK